MLQKTLIFFITLLLSSCFDEKNYDVEISNIDDRLIMLNDQLSSINSDIINLDIRISNLLNQSIQSSIYTDNDSLDNNQKISIGENLSDLGTKINNNLPVVVDAELIFKDNYSISSLSVLTCVLRNISENKVQRFYNGDEITINYKDSLILEYKILEINRSKRHIRVQSINYDKEFMLLYNIDSQ